MWIVYFPFIQEQIYFKKAVLDDQIVLSGHSLYETMNHQFKGIPWELVLIHFYLPLQDQATHTYTAQLVLSFLELKHK